MVEKEQALTDPGAAPQGPLELDKVLQPPPLTEGRVMDNPIEIDQIELPVSVSLLLNQQIGVSHVAGIQSCCVKRA